MTVVRDIRVLVMHGPGFLRCLFMECQRREVYRLEDRKGANSHKCPKKILWNWKVLGKIYFRQRTAWLERTNEICKRTATGFTCQLKVRWTEHRTDTRSARASIKSRSATRLRTPSWTEKKLRLPRKRRLQHVKNANVFQVKHRDVTLSSLRRLDLCAWGGIWFRILETQSGYGEESVKLDRKQFWLWWRFQHQWVSQRRKINSVGGVLTRTFIKIRQLSTKSSWKGFGAFRAGIMIFDRRIEADILDTCTRSGWAVYWAILDASSVVGPMETN